MGSLAEAMSTKPAPVENHDYMTDDDGDDLHFHTACLEEIDRYRRIDEWIPSYTNVLSRTALDCKSRLSQAGAAILDLTDFLQYTRDGTADELRLSAFANLIKVGILNNASCLRWFLVVLGTDPSPYMRQNMLSLFGQMLGSVAIGDGSKAEPTKAEQDGLTIEQETTTDARKAEINRKQHVPDAIQALIDEIGTNEALKRGLWAAVTSPAVSLREMADLLEICGQLYQAVKSLIVVLKYPSYWKCTHIGKVRIPFVSPFVESYEAGSIAYSLVLQGKLHFSRSSHFRTAPLPPQPQPTVGAALPVHINHANTFEVRENGISAPLPTMPPPKRSFSLKPPKKETPSLPSGASSLSSSSSSSQPAPAPAPVEERRPKIILKLGKVGGARSP